MSKEELVDAYLDGRLSRRTFIRRLVASGVSLGAALTYAGVLAPESPARASSERRKDGNGGGKNDDLYGGHTNQSLTIRERVRNPCNDEFVRIFGSLHVVVNVLPKKGDRVKVTVHVDYAKVEGVGLTTGEEYRGSGASNITFTAVIGDRDLYGHVERLRDSFVLAGKGRNKMRLTTIMHVQVSPDGRSHVSFDKIDDVECIA